MGIKEYIYPESVPSQHIYMMKHLPNVPAPLAWSNIRGNHSKIQEKRNYNYQKDLHPHSIQTTMK